ncbi:MAG: PQQ-binding-like beta-propeller repeat protein [Bdellovibrionota bacterium]
MYRIFIYSYLAFMMSVGFAHSGNYFLQGVTSQKDNRLSRPFRVGHFKFSRKTDRIKPLGVASYAGWTSASGLLIGAVDHEWVGAFSVTNGKAKWWLHSSGELTAPPTIYGSWVILGFRDGTLLKVEVLTGKVVWKANLDTFPSRDYTLVGSKLLVITASQYLYSVDFQSGETQWLVDGGRPLGLTVRSLSAPVVYNENVYFGTSSGEIVSVSMATGKIEWRYDPEYTDSRFKDIVGEMLVVNNRLIFSRYDGLVGAISLSAKQKTASLEPKIPINSNILLS